MIKNQLYLLSIFLFYFLSCSSESTPIGSELETESDVIVENGNSLLWRLEGKDCKTSYIYGTMHIIDAEYYHFTDLMRSKIEESDAIIMEVGGMPNPLETLNLIALDSGDIRDCFTPEQMTIIVEFFDQKFNTKPEKFYQIYGQMKPFFLMQAITQNYFGENTQSYDLDIMSIAGEKEIPLIGFETVEQQLGFFDQIPKEAMAEMVVSSIENFEKEKKETLKMMKIYSEQKVDKLIPLISKQSPEIMEYSDLFLYDRNKAWIPSIKKETTNKKCFIAVGAAHLFGPQGILELLIKEGYTLTAISTN
jgi:uncharacterized protein YbaP (TraB family)